MLFRIKMTSYAGTATASGWSWGTTWTGGDDANEDEEDGEDYHVSLSADSVEFYFTMNTCLGLRYRKRLFITASRLFSWNV